MATATYTAENGKGQIHIWGGDLSSGTDHWVNLGFNGISKFSHGHHVRTGGGEDTVNFQNLDEVNDVIVGRLEDFDFSRDRILINGAELDLENLPGNVRIVEYNGDHNDSGSYAQQWLLIDTGLGHIFYSLEGARVDMTGNGGANGGNQEYHFIQSAPSFSNLQDVDFIDQKNIVPAGFSPDGGMTINDVDEDATDVTATINGSGNGDLIAAGLNDDTVEAKGGNDHVWGGSGHDTLYGNGGADTVEGGTGDDYIAGGAGNDDAYGGDGNDTVLGNNGNDTLRGNKGNDTVRGQNGQDNVYGQTGNDSLFGGDGSDNLFGGNGSDVLNGGSDQDFLTGGNGADVFEFSSGDLLDWGNLSGTVEERSLQLDRVEDFVVGEDKIEFDSFSGVSSRSDLKCWKTTINGNMYFTVKVDATNERILVDAADSTEWSDFFNDSNFDFV